MIELKVQRGGFCLHHKWFFAKPATGDCLRAVQYFQTQHHRPVPGFVRQPFTTLMIDLTQEAAALLQSFEKTTRYEVRRASSEDIAFTCESNLMQFLDAYNSFAETKGLPRQHAATFGSYEPHAAVTTAQHKGSLLTFHSYLLDRELGRVRLLHSASMFRQAETSEQRNLYGRANRFLHYRDMLCFRELGFRVMDMGGCDANGSPEVRRIAAFKLGFGGEPLEECNYLSLPAYLYRQLTMFRQRLRTRAAHSQ